MIPSDRKRYVSFDITVTITVQFSHYYKENSWLLIEGV